MTGLIERTYLEKFTSPGTRIYFSGGDLASGPWRPPFSGKNEDVGHFLLKRFIYIHKDKNRDLGSCQRSKGFPTFFSQGERR